MKRFILLIQSRPLVASADDQPTSCSVHYRPPHFPAHFDGRVLPISLNKGYLVAICPQRSLSWYCIVNPVIDQ